MNAAGSPMRDDGDDLGYASSQGSDLAELEALRAELVRLRPMAELGRLAATVTHEIRNPLAGISASAELLSEDLRDPKDIELVDTILGEVSRLGNLVTDLLYYCRERPAELKIIDLAHVARVSSDLMQPDASAAGVRLNWGGTGQVIGDADLTRQALLNVVRNALQACSVNGVVRIEVAPGRIEIHDTGPGVPAAIRATLFDPFVTGRTRGLGLGATVARRCLQRQGGDLVLERSGADGSVFVMHWNAADQVPTAP